MSLFAAYADANNTTNEVPEEPWLQNSSFQIKLPTSSSKKAQLTVIDETDSEEEVRVLETPKATTKPDDTFYIDTKRAKDFLKLKHLTKPLCPRYRIQHYISVNSNKKKRFKRYFKQPEIEDTEDKTPEGESSTLKTDRELTKTTAFYNKSVYEEPHNVNTWLKFIDFQDTLFKSEKTTKKGSLAKGLRANAERKLNILEKALTLNPNSDELHRKRLNIMVSVYPADELQKQLKEMLKKDDENIILWQGFIEATQCSMSHCKTDLVLKLYTDCLSTLHKIRRGSLAKSVTLEESILRILYQCGLFLKQTGLFEQLWTLLKMYLEMNLGQMVKDSFEIRSEFRENQLCDLENIIFKSQLPSHELWLRTERLRESCHWLPVNDSCEDPQRIVLPEDVVELIQPITMPENTFRLTVTILTLLKIPLLPCRHTTFQELGLDYVPWSLDSIESILPIFYPVFPIDLEFVDFPTICQLTVGPQYLKLLPGQEEYLNFILGVMEKCIDCLQGDDKVSLISWWFKFQQLLILLDKNGAFKIPPNVKKRIKTNVKNLLKKPENRTNILFYKEYAMLDKVLNNHESCMKILETALNFIQPIVTDVDKLLEDYQHSCHLIRVLIENLIYGESADKALNYITNFVLGRPIRTNRLLDEEILNEASLRFKHITLQLLSRVCEEKLAAVKHFQPIFTCDWVICNGWFIYLTDGPIKCGTFLEEVLEKITNQHYKELIFEFYVAVLFKFCMSNPGYGLLKILDDVLFRAMELFPNNAFFLAVVAKEQLTFNSMGPRWWKTKNFLLKYGKPLPILLLIFITQQAVVRLEEKMIDTITGVKIDINDTVFKNIMMSLFRQVTKPNMSTRRCGLIWRLYLQFTHKFCDSKFSRKIYYTAVEECPWLKALYIDAAIYIPAELGQIQDLLIEKQLRIHITPEELDVLRD